MRKKYDRKLQHVENNKLYHIHLNVLSEKLNKQFRLLKRKITDYKVSYTLHDFAAEFVKCNICMNSYMNVDFLWFTCGHYICVKCLDRLIYEEIAHCPECREKITRLLTLSVGRGGFTSMKILPINNINNIKKFLEEKISRLKNRLHFYHMLRNRNDRIFSSSSDESEDEKSSISIIDKSEDKITTSANNNNNENNNTDELSTPGNEENNEMKIDNDIPMEVIQASIATAKAEATVRQFNEIPSQFIHESTTSANNGTIENINIVDKAINNNSIDDDAIPPEIIEASLIYATYNNDDDIPLDIIEASLAAATSNNNDDDTIPPEIIEASLNAATDNNNNYDDDIPSEIIEASLNAANNNDDLDLMLALFGNNYSSENIELQQEIIKSIIKNRPASIMASRLNFDDSAGPSSSSLSSSSSTSSLFVSYYDDFLTLGEKFRKDTIINYDYIKNLNDGHEYHLEQNSKYIEMKNKVNNNCYFYY